jgi:hypothetical protein
MAALWIAWLLTLAVMFGFLHVVVPNPTPIPPPPATQERGFTGTTPCAAAQVDQRAGGALDPKLWCP